MTYIKTFINAILSGICISIGGTAYMCSESKIVGAVLFTVGLMSICIYNMALFTGKIGYILQRKPQYILDCAVTWLGNLCGTMVCGVLIAYSIPRCAQIAKVMVDSKLQQNPIDTIVLGVFCGILMYLAVDNYRNNSYQFAKYLGIFVFIPAFIIAGFEHSIANMFYFSVANGAPIFTLEGVLFIIYATLGNTIGGLIIPNLKILADKLKQ